MNNAALYTTSQRGRVFVTKRRFYEKIKKIFITFIAISSTVSFLPQQAFADPLGNITTYTPSMAMWRRPVQIGNKVWSMNNSNFVSYDLVTQQTNSYAGPSNEIYYPIKGPDGNLWYAYYHTSGNGKIGKVSPAGSITEYTIPQERTGDVQPALTLAAGPDGRMWIGRVTYEGNNEYTRSILVLNLDGTLHKRIKYGSTFVNVSSNWNNIPFKMVADYSENAAWDISYTGDRAMFIAKTNSTGNRVTYEIPYTMSRYFLDITTDGKGNLWLLAASQDHSTTYIGKISHSESNGWSSSISQLPSTIARGAAGNIIFLDEKLWITHAAMGSYLQLSRIDPTGVTGGASEIQLQYIDEILNNNNVWEINPTEDGNLWMNDGQPKLHKIGTGSNGGSAYVDSDSDGLNLARETLQGTSDSNPDTDSDGLRDFLESEWSTIRNEVFCNDTQSSCEYPSPTQKDIYIEIDWMTRPAQGSNPAYQTKPSSSEIQEIKNAFAAKSINAHLDTGQLGGGNEISYIQTLPFTPTDSVIDFYDIKKGGDGATSQFPQSREGIYHYLVSGYEYLEVPGSTGGAIAGDDDFFVSYGLLKDTFSGNFSTAISGTIMHELGHNLCLTNSTTPDYPNQPSVCRFAGIDTLANSNYESVMNYTRQKTMVDYSTGANGTSDHDDWSAIQPQDFVNSNQGDIEHGALVSLQKKYKNNRTNIKKSPEYKKFLKDVEKLKQKLDHHHNR